MLIHAQRSGLGVAPAGPSLHLQHTPEFAAILHTVTEYLTLSLGTPPKDFTTDTPFMEAGLDSLDLLKVYRKASCGC